MHDHLLAVLAAIYCDGLNERQAAERLGITRCQVRTRHAAALQYIRNNQNFPNLSDPGGFVQLEIDISCMECGG